jgi:hypothetical protein
MCTRQDGNVVRNLQLLCEDRNVGTRTWRDPWDGCVLEETFDTKAGPCGLLFLRVSLPEDATRFSVDAQGVARRIEE